MRVSISRSYFSEKTNIPGKGGNAHHSEIRIARSAKSVVGRDARASERARYPNALLTARRNQRERDEFRIRCRSSVVDVVVTEIVVIEGTQMLVDVVL